VLETVSLELVVDVAEPPLSVAACSSEAVSQAPNNKTAANRVRNFMRITCPLMNPPELNGGSIAKNREI
jgi:hypothetical protein